MARAKKKASETVQEGVDAKRMTTAEFNLAAIQHDVSALAWRVKSLEEAILSASAAPWWKRFLPW